MEIGFVYKWTNLINNKYYIGSHKGKITDKYIGSGLIFRNAIKKYGINNFERTFLYSGVDFRIQEEKILKKLNVANNLNCYNLKNEALGGTFFGKENGMFGKHLSEKSKALISKHSHMKTKKGKLAHSIAMTGKGNGMYGRTHTDFSKNKFRNTMKRLKENWGFLKSTRHHKAIFYNIYARLKRWGNETSPRGMKTLEIENFGVTIPPYVRFCNFESRKLKVGYIKTELRWYLKSDPYDTSIIEHATLWKGMINKDGLINSNYGPYIFGKLNQFDSVIKELTNDKDSRRAVIMILQPYHILNDGEVDVPCTFGLSFRIRKNKLNMTVKMRSQDSYFGLGSDIPIFSIIHEMIYIMLKEKYPELEYGEYYHFVESFHIYERHFKFLKELGKSSKYSLVLCPKISGPEEVKMIRSLDYSNVPENYKFLHWLLS